MIRAVIADDHPAYCLGLSLSLRDFGVEVVGTAADGVELIEQVLRLVPDVVVTDIRMPRLSGIEACDKLRESGFGGAVVILSTYDEAALVVAAKESGARAFLSKDSTVGRIADVLRALITNPALDLMPRVLLPRLTAREYDVLRGLADGLTNKGIARRLGIGVETVKEHCAHLFTKLGVSDRLGAVNRAQALGFVSRTPHDGGTNPAT